MAKIDIKNAQLGRRTGAYLFLTGIRLSISTQRYLLGLVPPQRFLILSRIFYVGYMVSMGK